MGAQNMPAAEVDVTADLVRELLREQHPDLSALPLVELANGWDNVLFRLGDQLTVRLPRREMAAALVAHEQEWLPRIAPSLPLPIPAPVRVGRPNDRYPWSWSICPWFDGEMAADVSVVDPTADAVRLGEFLTALHVPVDDGPPNPYRAGPLSGLSERFHRNLAQVADRVDVERVAELWTRWSSVEPWGGPDLLVHGDLHTANVLVGGGRISAVIDFGDITAGDPAVDLAIAWMLFDGEDRVGFRSALDHVDDDTWTRGRAWALHFAIVYQAHSADNPRFTKMGNSLLAALLAD